ncbi:monovalent cation/H+ antiporter subunit D [Halosimplex carlsbadense 2-9-1]|uniref:Monovalent cation/H+ antiporter subunit D n=1 Tax=Halosimplex carlsbadense 2-9-1 TaxID=797114 RepID=M0CV77_9EURY|nr:Na(+)/H(+) antiporter subunit D [Halosimplex carlsbadense]ELZ25804.1 monovalent cation/H+ antiporter subunit D [Halosimplex carlsbadense 2-9-1]
MVDPLVPPFLPVALAALLLPFIGRKAGHALGALASAAVVPYVWLTDAGTHLEVSLFGFRTVLYNVDGFSTLMGLIFGFIAAAAGVYSYYSEADSIQTAFALSYVAASLGAVFGGDWLSLIFFWELMAVTSTLLVWYYGGRAVRAGFRYALLHGVGGTLLLGAVVWHYVEVGSFLFSAAEGGMAGPVAPVLAAVGIGVNVGFIGLHAWLPDTYPRPHVAASVFLCVFTTKTGVYGMYRAFPEGNVAIAYMGGLMAVFGATFALFQNDMRRLLSYHIQSQVGYMVAGVGIGTALGQAGAMAHVFNHILYKGLLFMTAGVVIYRTGKESLKKLGGLGREMPITAVSFAVAALSIAGFPGFNGFVSKGIVISASHYEFPAGPFAVGDFHTLELLLLVGGVGTFLSFIKFGYYAFLHGEYDGSVADANRGQAVAMVGVAALCVFYGLVDGALFAILPFDVTSDAVVGHVYETYTVDHVVEGVALAVIGLVGFVLIKKPLSKAGRLPDIDSLYNPAALYGTRALVVGVTELYAAADRVAVRLADRSTAVAARPRAAITGATGEEPATLRAGISTSIVLVALVAIGILFVLVV